MGKPESFDRETVMKQVTDLFWKKGFSATSMQDIVDATGLNRSSIYNSFGGKQEIYYETLKHYKNQVQTKSISNIVNKSPKQALRGMFEIVLKDTNMKGCYLSNCTTELANQDTKTLNFLTDNMDELVSLFTELIEKGKEIGEFRNETNSEEAALYLFSSLQGLRLTGMLVEKRERLSTVIDDIFKSI